MINNVILFRTRKLTVSYQRPFLHGNAQSFCSSPGNRNEYKVTQTMLDDVEDQYAATYGDLARKALKVYIYEEQVSRVFLGQEHSSSSGRLHQMSSAVQRSDMLGSSIIGLYCLHTGTTHYVDELLPHFPTRLFIPDEYSTVRRYQLLIAGPINHLSDAMIGSIFLQYCSENVNLINVLMRLNRRYCRVFSSDEVWKHVHYPINCWSLGLGNKGDEKAIWAELQKDHGVPLVSMNK